MSARSKSNGVNEKHGTLRVIAAASFIFAGIFLIFSLPFFWHQVQVLRNWPETEAQVLRSEVVGVPSGHDNYYRAQLHVLYTVAGNPVTAALTSFESSNYEATLQRTQKYSVGSHHLVRYDPANPTQARLGAGWNTTFFALPLIVLGMAAVFALIGAVLQAVAKVSG
ncbi:MAG TPA: DUF3592 domain-containing protein [Candidatus Methylomirabilis sp.]|nr:DUF3592 domain-containing protein [Candidatus Methylomirabilis sp.]